MTIAMSDTFSKQCDVIGVNEELGLVFGFAVICKQHGEDYYDTQEDHVTEPALLEAATDFAKSQRVSTDLHARVDGSPVQDGQVVFLFPLISDIAKALDITTPMTGLLIGMQPSPEVLAKFKDGTYTGFSIGGRRIDDEEVDA